MALLRPDPPHACVEALAHQLPAFLSAECRHVGHPPEIPRHGDLNARAEHAQRVFVLSLAEAARCRGSISPAPDGWRFFVGNARGKTVLARMIHHPRSRGWKLTSVRHGTRVWEAFSASRELDKLEAHRAADYELRLLTIPGLNLEAFWLKAQRAGAHDVVLPFPARDKQLVAAVRGASEYLLPNFLAEIRSLAASKLTMAAHYGA
jgi:hypothetical protein